MERRLPELLIGLVALAFAAVVTGFVVSDAIRDVKKRRDTITVTGSAREPIRADLATWRISVRAQAADAAAAARRLRRDVAQVRGFLREGGFSGAAVREPPLTTEDVTRRVGQRQFVAEYRITQRFDVSTRDVRRLERVAAGLSNLLARGALEAATKNARDRAERLVEGLGSELGPVRSATVGVFQIVPRNSTEISDYGVNDTTSPEKEVIAVVTVTFAVS